MGDPPVFVQPIRLLRGKVLGLVELLLALALEGVIEVVISLAMIHRVEHLCIHWSAIIVS